MKKKILSCLYHWSTESLLFTAIPIPTTKMFDRKSVNLIRSVLKQINRQKEISSDKTGNMGDNRKDGKSSMMETVSTNTLLK